MQRRLGLGDLDLGGGESAAQCLLGQVPGEEGLAAAVLPPNGFDGEAAGCHGVEVLGQGALEAVQADGELVEAVGGHGPAPQRGDDLITPTG